MKINWKDSYRIYPVSLDDLCKTFNAEGKLSKYDIKFNDLDLFNNLELLEKFKEYSLQDSVCLLNALINAQDLYFKDHNVDPASILSNSTLSLKIFRSKYLKVDIPILKGWTDSFIRKGYFGGATDYYKAYGENINYYDVNSLYPNAMKRSMPYELINDYIDMSNIKLDDFFGFCLAEIETPKDILRPLLPYKYQGKTIFPRGKWIGIYFSEELKAVSKHGYKINLIRGYEFSKINLFKDYVRDFFKLKRNAKTPAEKLIAKMHLNQLYGYFGRKQELIETVNVYNVDLPKIVSTRIIKSIIEINKDISTVLLTKNINHNMLSELNSCLEINLKNVESLVKSNVAIAAAVTSYARVHMIKYKLKDGIYYTDTDSIFTNYELNPEEIGSDIGLMKDELKGNLISEAYFLGIKQYGYYYHDKDTNERVEKSVFAGVSRDSLTFK